VQDETPNPGAEAATQEEPNTLPDPWDAPPPGTVEQAGGGVADAPAADPWEQPAGDVGGGYVALSDYNLLADIRAAENAADAAADVAEDVGESTADFVENIPFVGEDVADALGDAHDVVEDAVDAQQAGDEIVIEGVSYKGHPLAKFDVSGVGDRIAHRDAVEDDGTKVYTDESDGRQWVDMEDYYRLDDARTADAAFEAAADVAEDVGESAADFVENIPFVGEDVADALGDVSDAGEDVFDHMG
jgi:hypothetical protein